MAGMSFSSLPSAPGAAFGQSARGSLTSARNGIEKERRRTDAKRVFMVCSGAELTRIPDRDNEELGESIPRLPGPSRCQKAPPTKSFRLGNLSKKSGSRRESP